MKTFIAKISQYFMNTSITYIAPYLQVATIPVIVQLQT